MNQVDEIVYAKWDNEPLWYLGQVLSIKLHGKRNVYNIFFMDGYSKDSVPQSQVRKVPSRERKDPLIGKKFFDEGDYQPGKKRRSTDFKKGEFTVLCKQPGKKPSYWCERDHIGDELQKKREIEEFDCQYVKMLVDKYDKE